MSRQALEMALEALSKVGYVPDAVNPHPIFVAITAIKEALAQPEQEPLCTAAMFDDAFLAKSGLSPHTKLYTTPPKRTWVGLTPDDFRQLEKETTVNGYNGDYCPTWDLIEAVEEKLKEKNT